MKIDSRLDLPVGIQGPDPWDDDFGISIPLSHVICRDIDGTPHTVGEFIWPWTAYTSHQRKFSLVFYYWKKNLGNFVISKELTVEREARMRELQFLMTRQIYFGNENSPKTLRGKLLILREIACFAESKACEVRDVLTNSALLEAFNASLPDSDIQLWMTLFGFLHQLDAETQLGFTLASPKSWRDLQCRLMKYRKSILQHSPLPTGVYAGLINNLSLELDDIEAHKYQLLAAIREAITLRRQATAKIIDRGGLGSEIIAKHNLAAYLSSRGFCENRMTSLAGAIGEIFRVCKLQIHVFSGMRDIEATNLPFHCMIRESGSHGRKHCLIEGATTKFNKGRRLRTKWVTTENDGFRAIRLAQEFASMIYEINGVNPSDMDEQKDDYPLFPSSNHLPWMNRNGANNRSESNKKRFKSGRLKPSSSSRDSLLIRLCPRVKEVDVEELEEIDPFRSWREESKFAIGQCWPLTTHQLRRSLAVYANASGLVRISSLRRQLQHMTREMALYYGRGSTFCKNFIADNPAEYKKHVAVDWQDGAEEAEMLAFVRDVLNSTEPMFGGAGNFYERQRERGEVMSREEVAKQMKAGLLAYREGPLGGCTRPGVCETRKGLNLIDTVCATDGCKHLIGKHSKIVQTIRFKRAAMVHITPGSITEAMEREELEALERVEHEWRPQEHPAAHFKGGGNV